MRRAVPAFACIIFFLLAWPAYNKEVIKMTAIDVTSPAFKNGESIPRVYTCDGKDVSPPLAIGKVPPAAKSLALIVDDPDAPVGTWVHWVLWNIDPKTTEIRENSVPSGAMQGKNDFRKNNYGGPCPPSGTHRYFFKVYALNSALQLNTNATKTDLENAMKGRVLAEGVLMGRYTRK